MFGQSQLSAHTVQNESKSKSSIVLQSSQKCTVLYLRALAAWKRVSVSARRRFTRPTTFSKSPPLSFSASAESERTGLPAVGEEAEAARRLGLLGADRDEGKGKFKGEPEGE